MYFSKNIQISDEQIIIKTKLSFVFVNIRPFLPYHLLISPNRIVKHLSDLTSEETNDLFDTLRKSTMALKFLSDDFTITLQDGKFAGQTVPHLHIHLIPRKDGDLKENNKIYEDGALVTNIDADDNEKKNRSLQEMKKEADFLRIKFKQFFNNV